MSEKIANLIRQQGPISFRTFMEMALYDPEHGYYIHRREIGPRGDFYTGANIHPLFGELLADKLVSLFTDLADAPPLTVGAPPLTVVEVGAGTGQLAEDVLRRLRNHYPELFEQLSFIISELSPTFRLAQQQRLREFNCIEWTALAELEPESVNGIIYSNELIDAFPVYRITQQGGRLKELLVDWREGRFIWTPGDFSTPALEELLSLWDVSLEEAQIIEVNLDTTAYLDMAAAVLREGYLVTIDYGDVRPLLYSPARREGTLRCFYQHLVTDNPFERIGEQDMTASVDFSLLMEYGQEVGLRTVEFKRLREFMLEQGLIERLGALEQSGQDSLAQLKSKLAAKQFLMPGALGDHFKLLIQRKTYD